MPKNYPVTVKNKAFEAYLAGKSHNEIATELRSKYQGCHDVTSSIIRSWASTHKWKKRKNEIEAKDAQRIQEDIERQILTARPKIVERQLKMTEGIETAIIKKAKFIQEQKPEDMKTSQILDLSRSAQAASAVSARLAGITEKGGVINVMIQNNMPTKPVKREPEPQKIIDVKSEPPF